MTAARWTTLGILVALGCAPLVAMEACGGGSNTGAGADGGGGDGTVDGLGGDVGSGSSSGGSSSGGDEGGMLGGDGGCSNTCPSDVKCGRYTDCNGNVLECGMACEAGTQCTPGTGGSQSCQTNSCGSAEAGTAKCGEIAIDSCGVPINCPACPTGQTCVNNTCVTQTASDGGSGTCAPLTCTPPNLKLCGTIMDGCGNSLVCACETGSQCIGGMCQKAPPECQSDAGSDGGIGSKCGTLPNACGSGTVSCGDCAKGDQCVSGTCIACTNPVCGTATCGTVSNSCGSVSCGSCKTGQQCYDNNCCTPSSCEAALEGGVPGCAPVNLGCGVNVSCSPCTLPGEVCYNNACCTPSTCAAQIDAGAVTGCTPIDLGCGMTTSCAPCPGGQICQNNTCVACVPKTCADYTNVCGSAAPDGCREHARLLHGRQHLHVERLPASRATSSTRARAACRRATAACPRGRR